MKNFKNRVKQLVQDESGQGAAEYILLIALVVAIIMMFGPRIKGLVESRTSNIEGEFNKSF
jgi:Flp pilus assembly pilin Flp